MISQRRNIHLHFSEDKLAQRSWWQPMSKSKWYTFLLKHYMPPNPTVAYKQSTLWGRCKWGSGTLVTYPGVSGQSVSHWVANHFPEHSPIGFSVQSWFNYHHYFKEDTRFHFKVIGVTDKKPYSLYLVVHQNPPRRKENIKIPWPEEVVPQIEPTYLYFNQVPKCFQYLFKSDISI